MNMERPLLFDANSILMVIRNFNREAIDILLDNFTVSLAFYEIGNTLWKESSLLKRISEENATKLLGIVFAIVRRMRVIDLREDEELSVKALILAGKFNLTFYDATYLAVAQKLRSILVTEDGRLRRVAEKAGVKTKETSFLINHPS